MWTMDMVKSQTVRSVAFESGCGDAAGGPKVLQLDLNRACLSTERAIR